MRTSALLILLALPTACFNPDPPTGEGIDTDEDSTTSSGDASTSSSASAAGATSDDPSTTSAGSSESGDESSDGESGSSGDEAVCGDGMVNGDELCDDGVNDGSYGSCAPDCSANADSCGDGTRNGPEGCDDGVNDGAYGGCNADCTVAAFCGDGIHDDPQEWCDEGDANENGAGCNVDCTTSGTLVQEMLNTGLTFCDGGFSTAARFRSDGHAMISATGYCAGDDQVFMAVSPDFSDVEVFEPSLPETPVQQAVMVGDTWLMSSNSCNYSINLSGEFTEVCDESRTVGNLGLAWTEGMSYGAINYNRDFAYYGSSSPALGDMPLWTANAPEPGFYNYTWNTLARGPDETLLIGGERVQDNNGNSIGYFVQFTATGTQIDTNNYQTINSIDSMAVGPDGAPLLYSRIPFGAPGFPGGHLTKLNPAFGEEWTITLPNPGNVQIAVDNAGIPLVLLEDGNGNESYELRKLDIASGAELWAVPLPDVDFNGRLSVDEHDYAWVTAASFGAEGSQLWVGRVSP